MRLPRPCLRLPAAESGCAFAGKSATAAAHPIIALALHGWLGGANNDAQVLDVAPPASSLIERMLPHVLPAKGEEGVLIVACDAEKQRRLNNQEREASRA